MTGLSEIKASWTRFCQRPFPKDCMAIEIDTELLTTVDSFAAGCIDTFVASDGRLDPKRVSILSDCIEQLGTATNELQGEAKSYFEELLLLSESVLQSVRS